jgi:hypothetical protein
MSEGSGHSAGDIERSEYDRYQVGNTIARRSRTETPRLAVIRDELPELTNKELRLLDEGIEKAVRDVVVEKLRDRPVDTGTDETEGSV